MKKQGANLRPREYIKAREFANPFNMRMIAEQYRWSLSVKTKSGHPVLIATHKGNVVAKCRISTELYKDAFASL